jgi:hypothetical protein
MPGYCSFCGRSEEDCKGGLWHLSYGRPRVSGEPGICIYCARSAIRSFGETLDPGPSVRSLLEARR